ncbi:MAG: glutamine synthetase [Alphaproteobacteria bacterium CG11_big_fil_rev_8_21_14_0_20_39_49]|nr:MAG: glutamine synthetase [Alphaproteobacteria bacterium CG11_big_fil_rev_8_21_14_0_20_39_49]
MSNPALAEYIWLDGTVPVRQIRSKAKVVSLSDNPKIEDFPEWSFDGSSTSQATGDNSDCMLRPINFVKDPIRGEGNYIVMCEVFNADDSVHESNSRAQLRAVLDAGAAGKEPWIGFEQEYTLFQRNIPLGWPEHGYPAPQGPYYCGVGTEQIFGREIAEEHAAVCLAAGIIFYGINAEVMPGQWEFQIGYRGVDNEDNGVLNICDHMWIARWLLHRIAEEYDVHVSFENKPIKGDWNGAGMHTNFSTNETRDKNKGKASIDDAVARLSKKHDKHIPLYGHNLHERLTGRHETSSIHEFSAGTADRGRSIRVPLGVVQKGYGYFEDRRPGANSDPYLVAARITATVCDTDENIFTFNNWPRQKAA